MHWEDVPAVVDDWMVKSAAPSWDVKQAVSSVFTRTPAGYFFNPVTSQAAVHGKLSNVDFARCKAAAECAVGADGVLDELLETWQVKQGGWVKIAYSPMLRDVGESLNFFPGTYPGGLPNHASPLAAMLTSAAVGGGLGYGAGWLGEKVLPSQTGKKLKRTGAVLGALAGAAPGAMWALANRKTHHSLTDPWPFSGEDAKPTDQVSTERPDQFSTHDLNPALPELKEVGLMSPKEKMLVQPDPGRFYPELAMKKLGSMYTKAVASFVKRADFSGFGDLATAQAPTPYDVNVNHLGQTLWQTGASTPLLGATMSTMYAAQHMPDPNANANMVTGNQLGQLAMNAGKNYVTGLALGALVNQVVGTPFSAPAFGLGAAALGLVRAGVQSLFS